MPKDEGNQDKNDSPALKHVKPVGDEPQIRSNTAPPDAPHKIQETSSTQNAGPQTAAGSPVAPLPSTKKSAGAVTAPVRPIIIHTKPHQLKQKPVNSLNKSTLSISTPAESGSGNDVADHVSHASGLSVSSSMDKIPHHRESDDSSIFQSRVQTKDEDRFSKTITYASSLKSSESLLSCESKPIFSTPLVNSTLTDALSLKTTESTLSETVLSPEETTSSNKEADSKRRSNSKFTHGLWTFGKKNDLPKGISTDALSESRHENMHHSQSSLGSMHDLSSSMNAEVDRRYTTMPKRPETADSGDGAQSLVHKVFDSWGREVLIRNLKNGSYEITAGTVEALVDALAEESPPDTIYIEVFLLTYRHFSTPATILELLRNRFAVQTPEHPQTGVVIRMRSVNVLKKWIEKYPADFDDANMIDLMQHFLDDIEKTECSKFCGQLKNILEKSKQKNEALDNYIHSQELHTVLASVDLLECWSPKKIAQYITLGDMKVFKTINPEEFCYFLWGSKNDTRLKNFNLFIDRFNRLGFWVSTIVCSYTDIRKRAEIIEKFIFILKYLNKYQNFNSLMAVLSGLNTTSVSRLKRTWELVYKSSKAMSIYREIEEQMSYKGNFKKYRDLESSSKVPLIPFFGLYIKDLTFVNDGNQKHLTLTAVSETLESSGHFGHSRQHSATSIASGAGSLMALSPISTNSIPLINFEKCKTISEKIHAIRVFQQSQYTFHPEEDEEKTHASLLDTISGFYFFHPHGPPAIRDESELLKISKERESPQLQTSSLERPSTTGSGNYTVATNGNATMPRLNQAPSVGSFMERSSSALNLSPIK